MYANFINAALRIIKGEQSPNTVEIEPQDVICPNCKNAEWYQGPSAGLSENIACSECHYEFCNTPFGLESIVRTPEEFKTVYGIERKF